MEKGHTTECIKMYRAKSGIASPPAQFPPADGGSWDKFLPAPERPAGKVASGRANFSSGQRSAAGDSQSVYIASSLLRNTVVTIS